MSLPLNRFAVFAENQVAPIEGFMGRVVIRVGFIVQYFTKCFKYFS